MNNHQYKKQNQNYQNNKPNEVNNSLDINDFNITILGNTLTKISFCDKQCSNINENKVKSAIIDFLEKKFNINVVNRDYSMINPNTLRIVSFHQHILSPLTNGNPYLLLLLKIDNINCCIYIDKKLKDGYTYPKMHCVKYRFDESLYTNGTIFSGELIKDNERRWLFLIDNILIYKGYTTLEKNIISKFELIHNILLTQYTPDNFLEICPLQIKKLFLYKDIQKMIKEFIPFLSYTCKGIVFYTLNNSCSNFAFILPRESHLEIKTPSEINDIVQYKYPTLWNKKHQLRSEPSNTHLNNINNQMNNYNITNYITDNNTSNYTSNYTSNNTDNNTSSNTSSNTNNSTDNNTDNSNDIDTSVIDKNNVIFKIVKTDMPDIYNLYSYDDNNNLFKHGIALIPNIKISHFLYNTFKNNHNNFDISVECKFSNIFDKWIPIRIVNLKPYNKNNIQNLEEQLKNNN